MTGNSFVFDYASKLSHNFAIVVNGTFDPLLLCVISDMMIKKHFIIASEKNCGGG